MDALKDQLDLALREKLKISQHTQRLRGILNERERELMEEVDERINRLSDDINTNKEKRARKPVSSIIFNPDISLKVGSIEIKQDSDNEEQGSSTPPTPDIYPETLFDVLTMDNVRPYMLWKKPNMGCKLHDIVYTDDFQIAVTDRANKTVSLLDMSGRVLNQATIEGVEGSPITRISGMAYHPKMKALMVGLPVEESLQVLDPTSLKRMNSLNMDCSPEGIAVHPSGRMIITSRDFFHLCNEDGAMQHTAEYYDDAVTAIRKLVGLAVDRDDNNYLCDKTLRKVFKLGSEGNTEWEWTTEGLPLSIAVYKGMLFVAEKNSAANCWVNVYNEDNFPAKRLLDWPKETDGYGPISSLAICNDQLIVTGKEGIRAFMLHPF